MDSLEESVDRWFEFVEEYNRQSSVPLSYVMLPNPSTTGFRAMGTPIGMTNLSKREWNKLMGNNVPRKGNSLGGCHEKRNKLMGNNAPVRNLDRGVAIREQGAK